MSTSELLQKNIEKGKKTKELHLNKINIENDFNKTLFKLFKFAFITNCHLDEASVTGEELKTLKDLSTEEVFENFKALVSDLLDFKKKYKRSDQSELAERTEQFENMLQKLEAEIRGHIRVEHQLKLHIESSQNKIEELEKHKTETEEKLKKYESKENQDENKRDLIKDKLIQKFEFECAKLRSILEEKIKENEKLKKEIESFKPSKAEKGSSSIDILKKRLGQKSNDLNSIQNFTKEKPTRQTSRKKKRSLDENRNFLKNKQENDLSLSEFRKSSSKKMLKKSHFRSSSDQSRVISMKKTIV